MSVEPVSVATFSLCVDLDEKQGLYSLERCMRASRATPARFARMMGVTTGAMSKWLTGKNRISRVSIRAAYFAAAMSGVPLHMPKPAQYLATIAKVSKRTN